MKFWLSLFNRKYVSVGGSFNNLFTRSRPAFGSNGRMGRIGESLYLINTPFFNLRVQTTCNGQEACNRPKLTALFHIKRLTLSSCFMMTLRPHANSASIRCTWYPDLDLVSYAARRQSCPSRVAPQSVDSPNYNNREGKAERKFCLH